MKPRTVPVATALLALLATTSPAADAPGDSTATRSLSTLEPRTPRFDARNYFLRDGLGSPTTGYLTMNLNLRDMPWYEPPTRLEAIVYGAGTAATLGMFVGAVGNSLGAFDEHTTWLITGSLAAAGAVYAGTHYDPPPPFRLRWSER